MIGRIQTMKVPRPILTPGMEREFNRRNNFVYVERIQTTERDQTFKETRPNIIAEEERKLKRSNELIYLYCNLGQYSIIGNVKAPLLQIINLNEVEKGRILSKSFDRIHYHSILQHKFQTVEIDLRHDRGKGIPFQDGSRVVTVLHIRRKRYKGLLL